MRWLLYNLAMRVLVPVALVHLEWRSRRQIRRGDRSLARLGWFRYRGGEEPIWVHAASVGEVQAAVPLVRRLLDEYPDRSLVMTCFTGTGLRRAEDLFGDRIRILPVPYDLPGAVQRFLRRVEPSMLVVMETEIWPNLFTCTQSHGIPVIIASARMGAGRIDNYRGIRGLVRESLRAVTRIGAQTDDDAERFRELGAPRDRVYVTGNVKFDLSMPARVTEEAAGIRRVLLGDRPVWVAASTRAGEEEKILDAFSRARDRIGDLLLVLAPRHPDRAGQVASLCAGRGLSVVRRTEGRPCEADIDVFLVDTLGELPIFYAAADVVFVGGSLVPVGGHNLLEPLALGKPVLTGPYNDNARDVADLLERAGAVAIVRDADDLGERVARLFAEAGERSAMTDAARVAIEQNRGAVDRVMSLIHVAADA